MLRPRVSLITWSPDHWKIYPDTRYSIHILLFSDKKFHYMEGVKIQWTKHPLYFIGDQVDFSLWPTNKVPFVLAGGYCPVKNYSIQCQKQNPVIFWLGSIICLKKVWNKKRYLPMDDTPENINTKYLHPTAQMLQNLMNKALGW